MTIQTSHRAGTTFCRSLIVSMPGFALPPAGNFALQFRTAPAATSKLSFTTERGSIHIESYNSTEGVVRLVLLAGPRETQRLEGLYRGNLVYQDGPEVTTIGDDIDLRITAEGTSIVLPETPPFNDLVLWPDPIDLAGESQTTIMAVIERGLPGPQGIPGNMTPAAQQQIADALAAAQSALGTSADVTTKAGQVSAALVSINQTAAVITGQQADVTAQAATATGAAATATTKAGEAAASATTAAGHVTTAAGHATAAGASATTATTKATEAAASAAAAAASLAAMPATAATQAEADASTLANRWVAPAVLGSRPLRVTASVTVNVAVGDSIQGAIDSLNRYVFEGAAIGKVVLAAGIHTLPSASGLYSSHPQAVSGKIWLQGAAPAAVAITDFTGDKATDQAMLRARYPTTVVCPGHGVEITSAGRGLVVDQIHLEQAAGSSQYGLYVAYTDRGLIVGNVAASGFYAGAYGSHAGRLRWRSSTDRLVAAHCQYSLSLSGAMCDVPLLSVYPTAVGASLYNGAKWTTLGDSKFAGGTYGVYLALASSVEVPISEIKGYATGGVTIQRGSAAVLTAQLSIDGPAATYIGAEASTGSVLKLTAGVSVNDANTLGKVIKASAGSDVKILGSGVVGTPTYSPAPGVSGNTGSLITVY